MPQQVQNLLELVPRRLAAFEPGERQTVDLLLPRYGSSRIGHWLERHLRSAPIRVRLDEFGSAVWRLCDGRRNVHQIAQELERAFGARIQPVYDRLARYFRSLERRKLIEWDPREPT
ncbi:MAG TPA: PqqD family protein [Acidobacteriota bacterium]